MSELINLLSFRRFDNRFFYKDYNNMTLEFATVDNIYEIQDRFHTNSCDHLTAFLSVSLLLSLFCDIYACQKILYT